MFFIVVLSWKYDNEKQCFSLSYFHKFESYRQNRESRQVKSTIPVTSLGWRDAHVLQPLQLFGVLEKTPGFEFRVFFILDWLSPQSKGTSQFYYLTHSMGEKRLFPTFLMCIFAKGSVTNTTGIQTQVAIFSFGVVNCDANEIENSLFYFVRENFKKKNSHKHLSKGWRTRIKIFKNCSRKIS